jgi:hypothetical protein
MLDTGYWMPDLSLRISLSLARLNVENQTRYETLLIEGSFSN